MWLIQRFCSKLGLARLLQRYVRDDRQNTDYRASELFTALLFAIIMGLRRINKTEILQYNGAFLEMLGLRRFPDQSTLRRFLKRLTPASIRQMVRLHDSLRDHLFAMPIRRHSLTFDVDSVVLVIYGRAEKAVVGYNPKKPGRRSYHPLFCFEAHFQEFWHGTLRPGNAAASTGAIPFLKVCLAKAPSNMGRARIRFRMDSGFYGKPVVEFLDERGCGYVIVAKEHSTIKAAMQRVRFTRLRNGWECGQFYHQPSSWNHIHRYVVVRRPISQDPVEARQLTLFKDKKYIYHTFVTNLKTTAWRVYLFYRGRAIIEKNNREFLYDYPLAKIPTHDWTANVAFFQILLFAADIVHWFKRLCLPKQYRAATLDTIRTDFLVLPAKLIRRGNRNIITLPHDYHYQKEFLNAFHAINRLRLPQNFRICSQP